MGNGGFTTLQAAIDAAADGDTILLAPTHDDTGLVTVNKDVTIQGAGTTDRLTACGSRPAA